VVYMAQIKLKHPAPVTSNSIQFDGRNKRGESWNIESERMGDS